MAGKDKKGEVARSRDWQIDVMEDEMKGLRNEGSFGETVKAKRDRACA